MANIKNVAIIGTSVLAFGGLLFVAYREDKKANAYKDTKMVENDVDGKIHTITFDHEENTQLAEFLKYRRDLIKSAQSKSMVNSRIEYLLAIIKKLDETPAESFDNEVTILHSQMLEHQKLTNDISHAWTMLTL